MLYAQEAIDFVKKYRFIRLELWDPGDDSDPDWNHYGEWVEVSPEQFDEYGNLSIPENPQDLRADDNTILFVNSYLVSRHYGGPEEGGWWYNMGEPIESIVCTSAEVAERTMEERRKILGDEYNEGSINSVLGGVEISTGIETRFAKLWPEERPHYE